MDLFGDEKWNEFDNYIGSIEFRQQEFGKRNFDNFAKFKTHLRPSQNTKKENFTQYISLRLTLTIIFALLDEFPIQQICRNSGSQIPIVGFPFYHYIK